MVELELLSPFKKPLSKSPFTQPPYSMMKQFQQNFPYQMAVANNSRCLQVKMPLKIVFEALMKNKKTDFLLLVIMTSYMSMT